MKISITSGKHDLKYLGTSFGETSFAVRHYCSKFNKWLKAPHILFKIVHLPSIYVHISNLKLKLKEKQQNYDCITSHHLGEWETILQFGGKEWNIIAARESFLAQISQS